MLAATAVAVWAISTRTRPALAVYDSVPAPRASADTVAASTAPAPGTDTGRAGADSGDRPVGASAEVRRARPQVRADSADTVARPHRSDNYGGYSGYGSKERRGDPNARR